MAHCTPAGQEIPVLPLRGMKFTEKYNAGMKDNEEVITAEEEYHRSTPSGLSAREKWENLSLETLLDAPRPRNSGQHGHEQARGHVEESLDHVVLHPRFVSNARRGLTARMGTLGEPCKIGIKCALRAG